MRIIINKKAIVIIEHNSFVTKLFGLSFNNNQIDYGIRLKKCNAIHTFFMRQNIDVCITDKENNIIFLKENLPKNKIIFPIKKGYYTYELPQNSVKYLKINDKIKELI